MGKYIKTVALYIYITLWGERKKLVYDGVLDEQFIDRFIYRVADKWSVCSTAPMFQCITRLYQMLHHV